MGFYRCFERKGKTVGHVADGERAFFDRIAFLLQGRVVEHRVAKAQSIAV